MSNSESNPNSNSNSKSNEITSLAETFCVLFDNSPVTPLILASLKQKGIALSRQLTPRPNSLTTNLVPRDLKIIQTNKKHSLCDCEACSAVREFFALNQIFSTDHADPLDTEDLKLEYCVRADIRETVTEVLAVSDKQSVQDSGGDIAKHVARVAGIPLDDEEPTRELFKQIAEFLIDNPDHLVESSVSKVLSDPETKLPTILWRQYVRQNLIAFSVFETLITLLAHMGREIRENRKLVKTCLKENQPVGADKVHKVNQATYLAFSRTIATIVDTLNNCLTKLGQE